MQNVLRKIAEPESEPSHCDDESVLNDEAAFALLESDLEFDRGGDPIAGIGNGVLFGAAIWIAFAAAILLW